MIQNRRKLARFYERLIREEKISYKQALSIYEALHREAVSLGILTSKHILEGIDVDLRVARLIHRMKNG